MDNKNIRDKNVPPKYLCMVFLLTGYLLTAFILRYSNYAWIGNLMLGVALICGILLYYRLPEQDKNTLTKVVKKHDESPLGKSVNIFHYILWLVAFISVLALIWKHF